MPPADPATQTTRARFGAAALALALLSLWVQILQPLTHPMLLRALLDTAPDGYTIICTSDGPQLISSAALQGDLEQAPRHESNPLASTRRPAGDCCMGVATPAPLPGLALLAVVLVQVSEPAPFITPTADAAPPPLVWRPSQPRGPPLFA
ncbi:MAG: hypothetical protein AB7O88_12685 [Reyranellaceae bacterium]